MSGSAIQFDSSSFDLEGLCMWNSSCSIACIWVLCAARFLILMQLAWLQVAAWQGGRLQKVVVLTARLLSDAQRYILRCVRCHPSVWKCTISPLFLRYHALNFARTMKSSLKSHKVLNVMLTRKRSLRIFISVGKLDLLLQIICLCENGFSLTRWTLLIL